MPFDCSSSCALLFHYFYQQHLDLVHKDILTIENVLMNQQSTPTTPISENELQNALSRLKNNKAADVLKLTSEHFKLGRGALDGYLLNY